MSFKGHFKDVLKPDKLHVLSLSILLDSLESSHGGVGANIAYSLALLKERPMLIGSVGKDAKDYIQKLAKLGVNTENIHWSKNSTASFNVITDIDDNQIGGFYPGAALDSVGQNFDLGLKNGFYVISPDDPKLMLRLTKECLKNNYRLFYDVGQQINNIEAEDIKLGIEAAELLIVNDYELSVLLEKTGMTKSELLSAVDVLVTTLGKAGCLIESNKHNINKKVEAFVVKKVVDPTGAGDAFRAGFLYGYIRNWNLEKCAIFGNLLGSYAIKKHGTQNHKFDKEINKYVQS